MKVLKYVFGVIFAFIILILIVAAFSPSEYAVEREVIIYRPVTEVFDYVKYLKNQDDFSKWANMDPNMKKNIQALMEL